MPAFPNTVIRASAGTGKTFQLSNRFLGLAASGEAPDHILATTFARKAAGEILDRVLTRLAEAVDDPAKQAALAKHLEIPELDRAGCAGLLQGLIRRIHRLRIGTLDSFFVQLAGSFGLELDLPPGWRICDELVDRTLRGRAIQEVLREEETNDVVELMHLLSKGEIHRSITDEIFSVVNGLHALFLETDRNAWHTLKHRSVLTNDELTLAVEALENCPSVGTNGHMVKAHKGDVARCQEQDWKGFLGKGLGAKILEKAETYQRQKLMPDLIDVYTPLIDHAIGVLINQTIHQTEASWRLLDHFNRVYQRLKSERRALRFDDVTRCLSRGLNRLTTADVAYRLDAGITHLLLDEFQDTSLAQWSVLEGFAQEVTRSPRGRSFFCVGDVKQAIYGWRGGVSAVFDAVTGRLPNITIEPLNQSFRSSIPVIETVNAIFEKLPSASQLAKYPDVSVAWKQRFQQHSTARTEYGGYCRMVTAPRVAEGGKQPARTLQYAGERVAELARRSPGRSIGVLVRRNEVVARLVFELRERHGVAASEEGGNPLTDSTGVQVILSAMALADHPGDTAARFHLAHSPLASVIGLTDWKDSNLASKVSRSIREGLLRDGYGPTVYRWVKAITPFYDERELKRLLQLVELAYRFEAQATVRADEFIAFVQTTRVEDPSTASVRVMTVHQSKGLQFDIVVLPELDTQFPGRVPTVVAGRDEPTGPIMRVCRYAGQPVRGLLPRELQQMFDTNDAERVNESLCVLYVALTRAVHEMHMVLSPSRENERSLPATHAGLLRSVLTDGAPLPPEVTAYECGDVTWHEKDGGREAGGEGGSEDRAEDEPVLVRLAPSPERRLRGLDRQSPSGREGGGFVSLGRMMRLEATAAMARGTLIHKWFEQIEWLDDGDPAEDVLRRAALGLVTPDLSLEKDLEWFRSMLLRPAVRACLSRAFYASGKPATGGAKSSRKTSTSKSAAAGSEWPAEVHERLAKDEATLVAERERPFALRSDSALLQGTMDRVVWCRAGDETLAADIVDFKTDAVDPDNREAFDQTVAHYAPQMAAYRESVGTVTGLPPSCVTGRLIFVGSGIVVPM